jgi:hypothetical protein
MPRRKSYTEVKKTNQRRPAHIKGKSDVVYKGFQCLNSECEQFIFVRKDDLTVDFEIACPKCGSTIRYGGLTELYEYDLIHKMNKAVIESGIFSVSHDDYVRDSQEYKYCVICYTLKPLDAFDIHRSRKFSGRQGECRLCKRYYNAIKNQTRIPDQHREAAQKRRLYLNLAGGKKIDEKAIRKRFADRCFRCGVDLSSSPPRDAPLDHTLPAAYLWPLDTSNATLLCKLHNGEKSGKWPSAYYAADELKRLAVLTGIELETLQGPPHFNPKAILELKQTKYVDELLIKYAAYKREIMKLRNRIRRDEGFDFFQVASGISPAWISEADKLDIEAPNTGPDTDVL